MKKLITLLLLFTSSLFYAQDINVDTPMGTNTDPVYNTAGLQIQPEFPKGGIDGFYKYFNSKFKTRKLKNVKEEQLKAIVTFVIERDGSASSITMLRDPGHGVKEQVIKILEHMPKWKPGIQNGKPVRAQFALPITLNFSENKK